MLGVYLTAPLPSDDPQIIAPSEFVSTDSFAGTTPLPPKLLDLRVLNVSSWLTARLNPQPFQTFSEPAIASEHMIVADAPAILSRRTLPEHVRSNLIRIDEHKTWLLGETEQLNAYSQVIALASYFYVMAGALLLFALRLRERQLSFSRAHITFPSTLLPELNWRRKREWKDLSALTIEEGKRGIELVLIFASGGKAKLQVSKLNGNALEKLFIALDELAPHAARSPEMVAFRHKLFSSSTNPETSSYTRLWEEELQAHYSSTNFVTLSPGSTLQEGKIKVAMHLSSGGLSAVYLAEQFKRMVVVKESVLPVGEANSAKARELFQREARVLMSLEHPKIAKVLDHFHENGRDYLLLEYIPGITLREYIRRHGPESESKIKSWAKEIAQLLKYLHEQSPPVIHRDLTPDNLMITPSGELVLIDFGAANQLIGTATGTIVGKQYYISPEQFRGKAVPASDIYSLGGTLHFLLTGTEPEALSCSFPKQVVSTISDSMNDLIADCTRIELSRRICSVDHLLDRLDSIQKSKHGIEKFESNNVEIISLREEEKILQ